MLDLSIYTTNYLPIKLFIWTKIRIYPNKKKYKLFLYFTSGIKYLSPVSSAIFFQNSFG